MVFKRCLIGLQKGVSKRLKGHLLQAKKPLIRTLFMPFWFTDCEKLWQTEWDEKTEWHRDIYFNDIFLHEDKSDKTTNDTNCTKTEWHRDIYFKDIFLHEDWIDKTTNDTNCTKTEWYRDIYFNDIFLHEDRINKTTNYANDTNYITINISVIREIRSSYHKVQSSNLNVQR